MNAITKMLVAAACATLPLTAMWAQEENPMLTNAMRYIGTPYVAHTLEVEGEEEMTINCDEVDCTTLVEYVLAEAITPKLPNGDVSETAFAENLQRIRYRNGKIGGYTSRLHYASEWIDNAVKAGILEDITATRGTSQAKLQIDYMTTHTELYPKLANADNLAKMKKIERSLSTRTVNYLPKARLPFAGLSWIKDGDIIAFVSNIPGLDISHLGIAMYVDGKLTLLHASSQEKKVVISKVALSQMLKSNDKNLGIRVLRMK